MCGNKEYFRLFGPSCLFFVKFSKKIQLQIKAGNEYLAFKVFVENLPFVFVCQLAIAIRILCSKVKACQLKYSGEKGKKKRERKDL